MNYKKLYETQYGEKKLISASQNQFMGLRKLLSQYDLDRRDMIERLVVGSGQRVLDLGCGNGQMLQKLTNKFSELYGVDISPSQLQEAENNVKLTLPSDSHKFRFTEANLDNSLPFHANFFDVIICIAAIEHVYDIFSLVNEIKRVLKPGGFVVAEVPNIAYLKHRLALFVGRLPVTSSPFNWDQIGWDGGHIHYFTMKKICWLFQSLGFNIVMKTGGGFLAPLRNWWPSFLCGDLIIKAEKA
jgi:methionine biosynthesis protein MetW